MNHPPLDPAPPAATHSTLPLPERLIRAAEMHIALAGVEGAVTKDIVRDAHSKNTGAIQHHFGSKQRLVTASHLYRAKATNDFCRELLTLTLNSTKEDASPTLNQYVLCIVAPQAFLIQHTAPACYHAGFSRAISVFSTSAANSLNQYSWAGPMTEAYARSLECLGRAMDSTTMMRRLQLGATHIMSAWEAKELQLRSQFPVRPDKLQADCYNYAVELSEAISASLLRDAFKPGDRDASLAMLHRVNRILPEPEWYTGPILDPT